MTHGSERPQAVVASTSRPAAAGPQTCRTIDIINDKYAGRVEFGQTPDRVVSFAADMDVNTDGALTSYNQIDTGVMTSSGPRTRYSLNTICHGMRFEKPGSERLDHRKCTALIEEFLQLRDAGWPTKTRDGWRPIFYAIATPEKATAGKIVPCIQGGDWLVSHTAFPIDKSLKACNPDRYVDALRLNAIVMPKRILDKVNAVQGDLAAVRYNGRLVGAIVGDSNENKVGEGTVALALALKPNAKEPKTIQDIYKLKIGSKTAPQVVEYFVFPGTKTRIAGLGNKDHVRIEQLALTEAQRRGVDKREACGFDPVGARSLVPTCPTCASPAEEGYVYDPSDFDDRSAMDKTE